MNIALSLETLVCAPWSNQEFRKRVIEIQYYSLQVLFINASHGWTGDKNEINKIFSGNQIVTSKNDPQLA
jgi:hypothetical protein